MGTEDVSEETQSAISRVESTTNDGAKSFQTKIENDTNILSHALRFQVHN